MPEETYYDKLELKPLSRKILFFLKDKEPMKAVEIAEYLELTPRQVDAAITKSLVRYGLVIRKAHLTKVLKKEYNLIHLTDFGNRFIDYHLSKMTAD